MVLPGASRTLISPKLSELKEGVRLLFKVSYSLSPPPLSLTAVVSMLHVLNWQFKIGGDKEGDQEEVKKVKVG